MSASAPKRRRTSIDSGTDVAPPETVSSNGRSTEEAAAGGDAAAGTTAEVPAGVELVQPDLTDIPKLVLVDLQKDDVDVVATALKQLFDLILTSNASWEENQKDAISFGAVAEVLRAMRKWQMHEAVQLNGCRCLGNLAYKSNHGKDLIARSGGMEAVVNAMKVFPNHEHLNLIAAIALNKLFFDDSVRTSFGRRFVEDLNGLGLLLTTLSNFQAHNKINEYCCGVLYQLAVESDLREAIVKAGVVSAVASAMERLRKSRSGRTDL
jgi:hypothetical protein